jgi:hypothetical protein
MTSLKIFTLSLAFLLSSFAFSFSQSGYPSRDPNLDALAGFRNPPPGYGEVPFWWWSGDPLDKERLLWQIEELHKKGVTGMQVNYMHKDTPGWPTYPAEPSIFSDEWWEMWRFAAEECGKRNMGIGLSGYTLDWPRGDNLFNKLIYSEQEINGREIRKDTVFRVQPGSQVDIPVSPDVICAWAYPVVNGFPAPGGHDLSGFIQGKRLIWTSSSEPCEIWVFSAPRIPGTLNPVHPASGKRVIDKFFQPFQDHAVNQSSEGLNYFFQDELQFGVGDLVWCDDMADQFLSRKGYDLRTILPALFTDMGDITPKARLDFLDVKVTLSEERYFIPIFNWHHDRGLIYGADPEGRGYNPGQYGDNFRIQRWYTSPGHDTPGGHADLIKGKVSSSIANLYKRSRVWLEGYHSLGWGATPERLMYATSENYLYGCNLLNLHGLYYTTHGSFWEWAPPCYHFRMPYWDHMTVFLKYFERLSYLMSQGVLQADIALMYPVSPTQARLDGDVSTRTAFESGRTLFAGGYDFVFMDDQSVERSEIIGGTLNVSDMSFKVLILPSMKAMHWTVLQKAAEFYRRGGIVISLGSLPEASDRTGAHDTLVDALVKEMFGITAWDQKAGMTPVPQKSIAGGQGLTANSTQELMDLITRLIPRKVESSVIVRAQHRKIGNRDLYLVMDAARDSWCSFRSKGIPELWDPWTGNTTPVAFEPAGEGTRVRMPLDTAQAQLIVFSPKPTSDRAPEVARSSGGKVLNELNLTGTWKSRLVPTMDNRFGDFRLPVTETMIGAEARIFRYMTESDKTAGCESPEFNDSLWPRVTYGFGQKFWKLGPLPANADISRFEKASAGPGGIDPRKPVVINGVAYKWTPYEFSWRCGKEGDPGHQGYHGLKEEVTDEFICLGKPVEGLNEILYKEEPGGTRYYLFTQAVTDGECFADMEAGGLEPAAVFINGEKVDIRTTGVNLRKGSNPLLIRYDSPGRGHFVLIDKGVKDPENRTPLAMQWYDRKGRIPFDVRADELEPAGWYRFTAPPGLKGMTIRTTGIPEVWVDGIQMKVDAGSEGATGEFRCSWKEPFRKPAEVAMRISQARGDYGGSALPEPVLLDCGEGEIALGDWSIGSVLENYSGGIAYSNTFKVERGWLKEEGERVKEKGERRKVEGEGRKVEVDLGEVVATAEVKINGKSAGILVCPPWKLDITGYVKSGNNHIEVVVYNTLANHYLTVPTRYRGNSLRSGLIGPLKVVIREP